MWPRYFLIFSEHCQHKQARNKGKRSPKKGGAPDLWCPKCSSLFVMTQRLVIPGCEAARTALSLDQSLGKHFCKLGFHSLCIELCCRLEAAAALCRAPQSESEPRPRWTESTLLQLFSAVDPHSRH